MLNNEDFQFREQITPEQAQFVDEFMRVLFEDDLERYWNMVSDIDKGIAFGFHDSNNHYGNSISVKETIQNLRDAQREYFSSVRENGGVSQTVRYTKDGEAYIYLLEDVKESRTYVSETPEKVYVLRVIVETRYEDKSMIGKIKARVYDDSFRELKIG